MLYYKAFLISMAVFAVVLMVWTIWEFIQESRDIG